VAEEQRHRTGCPARDLCRESRARRLAGCGTTTRGGFPVEVFGWQGATREQPGGRPARPGGGDRRSNAVQTGTSVGNLALENLLDFSKERVLPEWFKQERLPRGPQSLADRVRVLSVIGEAQDAPLGMSAADLATQFEPVHAGHHDISDQQIDRAGMVVCKRQRLVAAFGHDQVVTGPPRACAE